MAPEYFSQKIYSTKSDIFSFGVLVLEIISGKVAFGSYQIHGRSYSLRRYVSKDLAELYRSICLELQCFLMLLNVYNINVLTGLAAVERGEMRRAN